MATEQFGDIVIAPRVLEKIIAIATAKVEGVYSLENKSVSDSLSKRSLGRGVYLHTEEDGQVSVDIYLYLEYGVAVPSVAVAIQNADQFPVSCFKSHTSFQFTCFDHVLLPLF